MKELAVAQQKSVLRQRVKARLDVMTAKKRSKGSAKACALLESRPEWILARSVLFYAPLPGEVDIWDLAEAALRSGKSVGLPRFDVDRKVYSACRIKDLTAEIKRGQFGIREAGDRCGPLELNRLDLVLVPGVAFDLQGRRLGRGKGYYDRLLEAVRGTTCGVAFDEQIERSIPIEPHDIILDCILTPTRWIRSSRRAVTE
jgi:5-formyltetrahydrofolate cyclo-ligase